MELTEQQKKEANAYLIDIKEKVDAYHKAHETDNDYEQEDARQAILEDPLEILVRSGWYSLGETDTKPAYYSILLATGGPAVRLRGRLDEYQTPETAQLEYQDWGTPWMRVPLTKEDIDALLAYAQCFYFGE